MGKFEMFLNKVKKIPKNSDGYTLEQIQEIDRIARQMGLITSARPNNISGYGSLLVSQKNGRNGLQPNEIVFRGFVQ